MSCPTRSFDDDSIHAYVAGTLPEDRVDAFELHLLGCAACRDAVHLGAGIQGALSPAPRFRRKSTVAAAALMLAAAAILAIVRPKPDTGPAAFTPPVFRGFAVRGAVGDDTVRAMVDRGMAAYQKSDFREAARLLDAAARVDASPGVSFYLAAAQLASGNTSRALEAAYRVMAPSDNPFAADAAIVAAKAWLKLGRPDSAAAALERAPRDVTGGAHAAALLDSLRQRP